MLAQLAVMGGGGGGGGGADHVAPVEREVCEGVSVLKWNRITVQNSDLAKSRPQQSRKIKRVFD
jgi:hypothetical protein